MIIVKWRYDGDYLAGANASEGFEWGPRDEAAMFASIKQFRRFERAALEVFYNARGTRWTKADVAFVRVQ